MVFEVVNSLGQTVMTTQFESCVYDQSDLVSMHRAGYRFKVDGRYVALGTVSSKIKESISAKPSKPNPEKPEIKEAAKVIKSNKPERRFKSNALSTSQDEYNTSGIDTVDSRKTTRSTRSRGKIKCIETGEVFSSQAEAARTLNIDPAAVSDSLKTGKTRSGYTFERVVSE